MRIFWQTSALRGKFTQIMRKKPEYRAVCGGVLHSQNGILIDA
jgi:hypothetical protein